MVVGSPCFHSIATDAIKRTFVFSFCGLDLVSAIFSSLYKTAVRVVGNNDVTILQLFNINDSGRSNNLCTCRLTRLMFPLIVLPSEGKHILDPKEVLLGHPSGDVLYRLEKI